MSNAAQEEYLKRRAAQERVAAKLANDARAARAHSELAHSYEDLMAGAQPPAAQPHG